MKARVLLNTKRNQAGDIVDVSESDAKRFPDVYKPIEVEDAEERIRAEAAARSAEDAKYADHQTRKAELRRQEAERQEALAEHMASQTVYQGELVERARAQAALSAERAAQRREDPAETDAPGGPAPAPEAIPVAPAEPPAPAPQEEATAPPPHKRQRRGE